MRQIPIRYTVPETLVHEHLVEHDHPEERRSEHYIVPETHRQAQIEQQRHSQMQVQSRVPVPPQVQSQRSSTLPPVPQQTIGSSQGSGQLMYCSPPGPYQSSSQPQRLTSIRSI